MKASMSLKNQLRKKAQRALPYFGKALRQRELVLIYEKTDRKAASICSQIMDSTFQTLVWRSIAIEPDTPGIWDICLKELTQLRMAGDIVCRHGFYLLWVGEREPPIDLQPDLDRVRNSRIPVTMDACILGGTEHIPPLRQDAPYRFLLLVDPELIHSADTVAMLLMMGAFLADPPTAGMRSRVFQVSSTLYNSVERDLALKVYSHLEAVLNGSRQDSQEKFQDEFALPDSARSKILQSLPGLTDLPVTGDLAALADTASGRFVPRLFRPQTQYRTIADALVLMFGNEGGSNISTPEWLMVQIMNDLPRYCEDWGRELRLEQYCYRLPLDVLLEDAPHYAAFFRERAHNELLDAKRECEDSLRKPFHPKGKRPEQLLNGLSPYLELWNRCIDCGLTVAWWEMVERLISSDEVKISAQTKSNTLHSDLAVVRSVAANLNAEEMTWNTDWRELTVENILDGQFSQEKFRDEDIAGLIEQAQSKADSSIHTHLPGQTVLFWDQSAMYRLRRIHDANGNTLLIFRQDGRVFGNSNSTALQVIPIPSLGEFTLWEARFDALP